MLCSQWIRQPLGRRGSRSLRRRQAAQTRNPVRPALEALEERVTPAQTAGSYNALVSAVAADTAANTNYVINITNSFTFATGGSVFISKLGSGSTLTIQGQNGNNFTLTGNGSNLFDIAPGQNVSLNNLTLTGGSGVEQGGAILDEDGGGSVTLSGMTIKTNFATGAPAQGGGVFVNGGALPTGLLIKNSTIANNVAQGLDGTSGDPNGGNAEGGGVFLSGFSFVDISNSTLSNNRAFGGTGANATTPGANGGNGGLADGGGLFANGTGWGVTLTGDTFSGNAAFGAIGGRGAAGANAVNPNSTGGNGGNGGDSGSASGGGLFAGGNGSLAILNDLAAPLSGPSIFINNSAVGPDGAVGGAGGKSTGSAKNSIGGAGNNGENAFGGGVFLSNAGTSTIANTTFFGNSATANNGGAGGAAGTGGTGGAGAKGGTGQGGDALGGGLYVNLGTFTMLNSTVAKNTGTPGSGQLAFGGGVWQSHATSALYENNTITQNSVTGGSGAGMSIDFSTPSLYNNLIQGNTLNGFGEDDIDSGGGFGPASNSSNNFVSASFTSIGLNPATNIVGKNTAQLGAVVGLSGGPIYYPLLAGSLSIGAGTPNVLNSIATVEGPTPATDEVGDPRTSNGTVSIGAVQPLPPGAPLPTTVVPGNASVNFYGTNVSPALQIAVAVNSASFGNVFVSLLANNTSTPLGTAPVGANGLATVNVPAGTLPASLPAGSYQLLENYSGNGSFTSGDAIGTLTVPLSPTTVVPGNATIPLGSTATFTIPVEVNSPDGTVNSGSVTISLVSGTTTTNLTPTPVNVSNGVAKVSVSPSSLPSGLTAGSYDLIETYTDVSGPFAGGSASGALTITSTPTPSTSVAPANAVISTAGGNTLLAVVVNSPAGTVNFGTVTISLVSGGTTTVVGSHAVLGGSALVPASFPANLSPGTYQLIETYSDSSGHFNGSSTLGTLTVDSPSPTPLSPPSSSPSSQSPASHPPTPIVAALEIAIDVAALALQSDPPALLELQLLAQSFLGLSIPPTSAELSDAIQALLPLTDDLGSAATLVGLSIALSLENG